MAWQVINVKHMTTKCLPHADVVDALHELVHKKNAKLKGDYLPFVYSVYERCISLPTQCLSCITLMQDLTDWVPEYCKEAEQYSEDEASDDDVGGTVAELAKLVQQAKATKVIQLRTHACYGY